MLHKALMQKHLDVRFVYQEERERAAVLDAKLAQALEMANEFQYNQILHLIQGSERKEQT